MRAQPRDGEEVVARALDVGEEDRFALDAAPPARGWRAFVRGAVAELAAAGLPVPAVELEISGDVPAGAGLASSAALEGALCLALLALADADDVDRLTLARICSRIEHRWVGAQTGLLDQIASLFGARERALRIDFLTLEIRSVALELGAFKLVTLDSGEHHDISTSQRGHQHLLDVGTERGAVDRSIEHRGGRHLSRAERCDDRVRLPVTAGRVIRDAVAAQAPRVPA